MSDQKKQIRLFEDKRVRYEWDEENEKWWFSVVDVIEILTDQPTHDRARKYWSVMKTRLKQEGAQPTTICSQLKMEAYDGKIRLTDVADTEQLLRIIQSVPSPKAEPFKLWLAKVGSERLDETVDPELSIDRAIQNYRRLGYSENWINQRIKSIEVRKALTDEWDHIWLFRRVSGGVYIYGIRRRLYAGGGFANLVDRRRGCTEKRSHPPIISVRTR